ncbi:MAG: hypothetical protein ACPGJV_11230 [Bacteriovoracaceae bacterium]
MQIALILNKLIKNTEHYKLLFLSFFIINFVCFSPVVEAKRNELLRCLAREETRYHKTKARHPLYHLNQKFINALSSNSDLEVKSEYLKEICSHPKFPPSMSFLRSMMLKGKSLFVIPRPKNALDTMVEFKKAQLSEFINRASLRFFDFLSNIQASAPDAHCLERNLKGYSELKKRYYYLQTEFKAQEVLKNQEIIANIFDSLTNIESLYRVCERQAKQLKKAKDSRKKK